MRYRIAAAIAVAAIPLLAMTSCGGGGSSGGPGSYLTGSGDGSPGAHITASAPYSAASGFSLVGHGEPSGH